MDLQGQRPGKQIANNYDKEVFNGDIGRISSIDEEVQMIKVAIDCILNRAGEVVIVTYFKKSGGRMEVDLKKPDKTEGGLKALNYLTTLLYYYFYWCPWPDLNGRPTD